MTNLKSLRSASGKSQQDVADYLGCTRQAYGNYENGIRTMDYETLLKLAEYFDTTVDFILRGEEKSSAENGRAIKDEDIKFALFNGAEGITDAQFEEVKRYAQYIKERGDLDKK